MENEFKQEPMSEYQRFKAMNSGSIVNMSRSAHEYKYFKDNPKEATPQMELGRMLHYYLLEPDKFNELYVVPPKSEDYPRAMRTVEEIKAKCKEFGLKVSGKKEDLKARLLEKDSTLQFWDDVLADYVGSAKRAITESELNLLIGLVSSIVKHNRIKKILAQGIPEMSGYWLDTKWKIPCKMRADWLTEKGYIVDLKTTTEGHRHAWEKKMVKFRYDIQAAWYCRGFEQIKGYPPKGFIHIVVETKPPFNVYCYFANPTVLECGRTGGKDTIGYEQALDNYLVCMERDEWPMPQMDMEDEAMPDWFI